MPITEDDEDEHKPEDCGCCPACRFLRLHCFLVNARTALILKDTAKAQALLCDAADEVVEIADLLYGDDEDEDVEDEADLARIAAAGRA
jgi:hypothetical protein